VLLALAAPPSNAREGQTVSEEVVHRSGSKERVCFLADARSPLVHQWLRHASDIGYDVHLISIDPLVIPLPGVTAHHVHPKVLRSQVRMIRYALTLQAVHRLLRQLSPDIVHAHYAWGYGLVGALTSPSALVVSLWGSDLLVSASASAWHGKVMRFTLGRADRVCATSEHLVAMAAPYTDKVVVRTPFGVDCDTFKPLPRKQDGQLTIGMVKRLDDNSGVEYLLRAFAQVHRDTQRDVRLRLVGGVTDQRWQELAADLGIAEVTTFRGHVDAATVPEVLRGMDVFVQPSRNTEGFGVAVLEAEATGIPVVASDLGGLREVVVDGVTGVLVPPGDVDALAFAILELVSDDLLRHRMGASARTFVVNNYDWPVTARLMDAVYREILST